MAHSMRIVLLSKIVLKTESKWQKMKEEPTRHKDIVEVGPLHDSGKGFGNV